LFFVRWHPDFNFFFSRPKIAKKNENFCCKFHRVSNGTGESGVGGGHFGEGYFEITLKKTIYIQAIHFLYEMFFIVFAFS